MNLIEGSLRRGTIAPDASAAPKSVGGDGAESSATFGDILSKVSTGDSGVPQGSSARRDPEAVAAALTGQTLGARIRSVPLGANGARASEDSGFIPSAKGLQLQASSDAGAVEAAASASPQLFHVNAPSDDRASSAPRQATPDGAAGARTPAQSPGGNVGSFGADISRSTQSRMIAPGVSKGLDDAPDQRSRTTEQDLNAVSASPRKQARNSSGSGDAVPVDNSNIANNQIAPSSSGNGASAQPTPAIAAYQPVVSVDPAAASNGAFQDRAADGGTRVARSAVSRPAAAARPRWDALQTSVEAAAPNPPLTSSIASEPSRSVPDAYRRAEPEVAVSSVGMTPPLTSDPPASTQPRGRAAEPNLSVPAHSIALKAAQAEPSPSGENLAASLFSAGGSSRSTDESMGSSERGQIKVAVLDRQVHLPPVLESSPVYQIADRIAPEAQALVASLREVSDSGASSTGAPAAATSDVAQLPVSPAAVRSLNLRLEPESLGAVRISLRLSGSRLEVQVETARAAAMQIIDSDKDRLAERLRSSAYALDSLVVKLAEQRPAQPQLGTGQSEAFNGQATLLAPSSESSREGGRSAHDQPGARRENLSPQRPATDVAADQSGGDNNGAVYL